MLAPEESFVVDPGQLHHRHPATTPYAGRRLYGVVRLTLLRGQAVDPGRLLPRRSLLEEDADEDHRGERQHQRVHDRVIAAGARRYASPGTQIEALRPFFGPQAVDCAFESYLSAVGVMDRVLAYREPYDAVVLAGFGEHGRDGLQELIERRWWRSARPRRRWPC